MILDKIEKNIVKSDKIIILSKKTNDITWYSTLLFVIIVSTIEFFRISKSASLLDVVLDIIIVIFLIIASYFIFFYKKLKIKIIKNIKGDILVEKLESITIKEQLIKNTNKPYIYSIHFNDNFYGIKIRYKNIKSRKIINLGLLPHYFRRKLSPVFINKDKVIEIGKFLDLKIVFIE